MEPYLLAILIIIIIALIVICLCLLRCYIIRHRTCPSRADLTGKIAIVTGANIGLGKETALELSLRGAKVILACRNEFKGKECAAEIRRQSNQEVVFHKLDLASLKSVQKFSQTIIEQEPRIDILVNNAGVFRCPYMQTEDGFEMHMGVNYLGHFLLTNLLLDLLKKSSPSRVVCVGSFLYARGNINFKDFNSERSYDRTLAYCNSKLALSLFCRELSKHLRDTSVNVYCVNPGIVRTNLLQHSVPVFIRYIQPLFPMFLNAKEGAQSIINCAISEQLAEETGFYYSGCRRKEWHDKALNEEVAKRLWEFSERLTGLS
ncbi:retinol dehydrogenase 14-like [Octopus sinensis]|uniref:Retinol dehydrogenase 14-like n=1 Tax=Octopus sinensis TaxID=2607531 RepID=A0A7E6F6H7_9MOLL|nr:retinol dehydrogenase 14-like [Octopus sinensis]